MNLQKFTQKRMEAFQAAQSYKVELQNQQMEEAHLLYALLSDPEGLILSLLKKMGVDTDGFSSAVKKLCEKLPHVSGSGSALDRVYVSKELEAALSDAENEAKKMKDDFVSVEHIMLGILENPDKSVKALLENYRVTRNEFLTALMSVRGNQKVTSDNPESTYDVLKKYGQDLVSLAREQK